MRQFTSRIYGLSGQLTNMVKKAERRGRLPIKISSRTLSTPTQRTYLEKMAATVTYVSCKCVTCGLNGVAAFAAKGDGRLKQQSLNRARLKKPKIAASRTARAKRRESRRA